MNKRMKVLYALSFMCIGMAQVWAMNETMAVINWTSQIGNNTGVGIPHGIGVWDVQGMGVGQCLGSRLPPSIPTL